VDILSMFYFILHDISLRNNATKLITETGLISGGTQNHKS
jgi:hypothetical protein